LRDIDDSSSCDPFIFAVGNNANGELRIAYYDIYESFELGIYEMGIVNG